MDTITSTRHEGGGWSRPEQNTGTEEMPKEFEEKGANAYVKKRIATQ